MLMINKSKVLMNSKDIKHDLCLVFHAIEDEFSVDYLGKLIVECLDLLAEFYKSEAGKNEEKSKVIKASNLEEAIKITKELDIPEEIKNQIIKELKEMK